MEKPPGRHPFASPNFLQRIDQLGEFNIADIDHRAAILLHSLRSIICATCSIACAMASPELATT